METLHNQNQCKKMTPQLKPYQKQKRSILWKIISQFRWAMTSNQLILSQTWQKYGGNVIYEDLEHVHNLLFIEETF